MPRVCHHQTQGTAHAQASGEPKPCLVRATTKHKLGSGKRVHRILCLLTQNSSVAQAGFKRVAILLSQSPRYLESQA